MSFTRRLGLVERGEYIKQLNCTRCTSLNENNMSLKKLVKERDTQVEENTEQNTLLINYNTQSYLNASSHKILAASLYLFFSLFM